MVSSWRLEAESWKLEAGGWRLKAGCSLPSRRRRLRCGRVGPETAQALARLLGFE
jgi:hypothetical protein